MRGEGREAQKTGYTKADPTFGIDGRDAPDKLCTGAHGGNRKKTCVTKLEELGLR